jgi:PAS domain S-box-containing protein
MRIGSQAAGLARTPPPVNVLALALLALLFFGPFAAAAGPRQARLVVVLYPEDNDGRPMNLAVDQSIRSTFATGSPQPVEVHNEYLDVSRFGRPGHQQNLAEFLRRKYAGRKVDVVIAGLASALDFALAHRQEVFPGVPIVFCAVEQREVRARKLPPDVIGVPAKIDFAATLDLALRLHPGTRRVVVIAGSAKVDAYWEAEARQAFRGHEGKVELVYLSGLPMDDLLREVARLPERSIIYYLHVSQDGTGKAFVPAGALEPLAAAANAPVYGHVDTFLGRGLVGGRVVRLEAEGNAAARLGLRILAGERPEDISALEPSEPSYLFDWRQLRRWGVREDSLPPGSVIRYKQPSFWDLYRWHILGVASLCVIEALLIFGLLVQRLSRRRAEKRFRQVVEAAPNGMVIVGHDGTIVLANAQMEKLFGYSKEEMLGQPVEMLVPERFRKEHPTQRNRFLASPEARAVGAGRELFGRRKDGSEVPVEIGLSPVQTDMGPFVLASIIDVTERRQAEEGLRESQRQLRSLTGRLLVAQETERRRIARELHDDLNQGLALLAVEMEVLAQRPPESAAQLGGRMQELSARVKGLSSTVHGLSHQLHPSKLEQLGLVVAVRSLCRELTEAHGLPIEFTHHQVPEAIPEDTALCLYRIAQEALRNVLKHSGARHAGVELTGSAGAITLRVADDGAGFDPRSAPGNGGLGLVSMRERLRLVGGELAIDSPPAGGARVDVRVPLGATGPAEGALPAPPARVG